jgi:CDP-diacylglycerol--glycerol-3-phosphate 3-phosphatidyltransferase
MAAIAANDPPRVPVNIRDLPNLLGLFRIVMTPVLVILVLLAQPWADLCAAALLVIMAVTDIVDGRLARKLQVVSPLGVFLDTISDKIFVAGALIPLVERQMIPAWLAVVIVIREFAVSGLRSYAAAAGQVIAARQWGKQKMVFTVMAIVWRLVDAAARQLPGMPAALLWLTSIWYVPLGVALVLTVFSGVDYFWKAWSLLRQSERSLP